MTFPTAPAKIDPVDVVGQSLKTYGQHINVLLPLSLPLFLIPALFLFAASGGAVSIILYLVLSAIAGGIYTAVLVEIVRDVEDGTLDSSIGDLISSVLPIVGAVLGLSILQALAVTVGTVLFIVPGLFLLTIWAVTVPVLVLERKGVIETFGRSQALVKGNGWQVFGVVVLLFILNQAVTRIAGSLANGLSLTGFIVAIWIVSALVAPIGGIVATKLYLRLRAAHGEEPLPTGKATPKGPQAVI